MMPIRLIFLGSATQDTARLQRPNTIEEFDYLLQHFRQIDFVDPEYERTLYQKSEDAKLREYISVSVNEDIRVYTCLSSEYFNLGVHAHDCDKYDKYVIFDFTGTNTRYDLFDKHKCPYPINKVIYKPFGCFGKFSDVINFIKDNIIVNNVNSYDYLIPPLLPLLTRQIYNMNFTRINLDSSLITRLDENELYAFKTDFLTVLSYIKMLQEPPNSRPVWLSYMDPVFKANVDTIGVHSLLLHIKNCLGVGDGINVNTNDIDTIRKIFIDKLNGKN